MRIVAIAVFIALSTGPSEAAGFLVRETDAESVGMSYGGNGSRADSAATAFLNPAGLTQLSSTEVEIGAAAIMPDITFKGRATVAGQPLPGNTGGDSGRTVGVPDFYVALPIADNLALGLAMTVPFGNSAQYDSNWYGRYLATKATALSYDINPSIAYAITPAISVGVGISAQYLKLDLTSVIPQSLILGAPIPDAFNRFEAHDWAVGFNLGTLIILDSTSRFGITFRSGVDHDIKGSLTFSGASPFLGLINGPASASLSLPDQIGASLSSGVSEDVSLFGDVQLSRWSTFKTVSIESSNPPIVNQENFRDSWLLALGAKYKISPDWTATAGLAWDQSPVTSAYRSVVLPDSDRWLMGIGAQYTATDHIEIDGAYEHALPFLHPNMNISANNTDPITHAVVLQGSYDVAVDIVALSARYRF
jgi:long-chain fatty acid transport protein